MLRLWQGLGYPRRARDLQRAAVAIAAVHGGEVPDELEDLLALPGIGPYTARAVLAFAYERDVAVVDTNIARVLARTAGERLTGAAAQRLADGYVPRGRGVGVEPGVDGPRRVRVPTDAAVRPVPAGRDVRVEPRRTAAPDPAVGSAGVSTRQAPYAGSDRQARGDRPPRAGVRSCSHVPRYRDDIVGSLVDDGLVVEWMPARLTCRDSWRRESAVILVVT